MSTNDKIAYVAKQQLYSRSVLITSVRNKFCVQKSTHANVENFKAKPASTIEPGHEAST